MINLMEVVRAVAEYDSQKSVPCCMELPTTHKRALNFSRVMSALTLTLNTKVSRRMRLFLCSGSERGTR